MLLPLTLAAAVGLGQLAPAPGSYEVTVTELETRRLELAAASQAARGPRRRAEVLTRARAVLLDAIATRLLPPWLGTPWAMDGISAVPGEGEIACSYLVSTLLQHAGFKLNRYRLAQQGSAQIVETLAPPTHRWRLVGASPTEVVASVRSRGDGLYVVGLDYHVGFLIHRAGLVEFCHSSFLPPARVVCEDPGRSDAMVSSLHVLGDILSDRQLRAWLAKSRVSVARTRRAGARE